MLVEALHAYRSSSCFSEGMVHHGQRMYTNIELLQYIQNVARGLLLHAICVLLHARDVRAATTRDAEARGACWICRACHWGYTCYPLRCLPQRRTSE